MVTAPDVHSPAIHQPGPLERLSSLDPSLARVVRVSFRLRHTGPFFSLPLSAPAAKKSYDFLSVVVAVAQQKRYSKHATAIF